MKYRINCLKISCFFGISEYIVIYKSIVKKQLGEFGLLNKKIRKFKRKEAGYGKNSKIG